MIIPKIFLCLEGIAKLWLNRFLSNFVDFHKLTQIHILLIVENLGQIVKIGKRAKDLSSSILKTIFDLSKSKDHYLLIYIRDDHPNEDFIYALSAIQEVYFVILKGDSLRHISQEIHADEVYLHDGKALQPQESVLSLI